MSSSFKNKIVCGDCIELLSKVSEPFVDLVFADKELSAEDQKRISEFIRKDKEARKKIRRRNSKSAVRKQAVS